MMSRGGSKGRLASEGTKHLCFVVGMQSESAGIKLEHTLGSTIVWWSRVAIDYHLSRASCVCCCFVCTTTAARCRPICNGSSVKRLEAHTAFVVVADDKTRLDEPEQMSRFPARFGSKLIES